MSSSDLFEALRHKVVSAEELLHVVGRFPRKKTVIMCHGVFDIVHPGHVRHFAYAKSKADCLIVSVTSDRHIKKGKYRPHVPQELRALSVAAFELVDYVIIDEEPVPIRNIGYLQPDFFAKGFEYTEDGLLPATREEAVAVKEYGGQIIFTPGDVVYSSSRFLDSSLPSLHIEKILAQMDRFNITFDSLRFTLDSLSGQKVHTVGDTIIDTYTRTSLIGGQIKTPTLSVLYQGKEDYVGGAGIVAQHMKAAGAEVQLTTVLGNDPLKEFTLNHLAEAGIHTNAIIDNTRPTTNKNVIVADSYRLVKIDTVDSNSVSEDIIERLANQIVATKSECVVFSDFRHGIFNRFSIPNLVGAIQDGVMRVADSQVATRWGNITDFKNFDLVTPNEREARFALGDQDSNIGVLADRIRDAAQSKNVILTLGDRGVFYLGDPDKANPDYHSIDSFADSVIDPVGAGDALLAYATLTMMASGSILEASILGSFAAGCECELDGNIPIKVEHVHEKIDKVENLTKYKER